MNEIHSFNKFSICRTDGGDYVAEHDDGRTIIILSPTDSDEHKRAIDWITDTGRTEDDFICSETNIIDGVTDDA